MADIQVVHFADPWCFWSWALEPLLQRLRAVYGENLSVVYRMGGVFDDFREWQDTYEVDDRGTIDWIRKAGLTSKHPQDPNYMLSTKVKSSYRSCRAFKAAEKQDSHKAERYFRRLMEVFQLEAKPPTDETLLAAAADVGLDRQALARDLDTDEVNHAFMDDRKAMRTMRVNFLSLVILGGTRPMGHSGVFESEPYERIINDLFPNVPKHRPTNILDYLSGMTGHLVHAREIAEVFRISDEDAQARMQALHQEGLVGKRAFDFGVYWVPQAAPAGDQVPAAARVG